MKLPPRSPVEVPIRLGVASIARRGLLYIDQASRKLAVRTPWGTTLLGGGGTGDLVSTNNLSDVASARAALQNLGAPLPALTSIGTWTLDEDGSHIREASGGSTFSHKVQYITAPATPWVLAVECSGYVSSDATYGLWARRSSNGKVVTWSLRSGATEIHVYRWTDVNTFSADAHTSSLPTIPGRRVLAMASDGTTLTFHHLTGVGMGDVATLPTASASETIATHLGGDPDQIGFYLDTYNAEGFATLARMRSY